MSDHPSAVARAQRLAQARQMLADGLTMEQAAGRLGYAEAFSLRRALRQEPPGPLADPPPRPPTLADDLAAVSAQAAALEADAQAIRRQAEVTRSPDRRAALFAEAQSGEHQARKLYERKRILWAARHPYTSERKTRERRAA